MATYPIGSLAQGGVRSSTAEWPAGFEIQVPGARRPAVNAEELFTELNGCQIGRGGEQATVEIYSVSDLAGHRWIQVGLHGATEAMFTVEVPSTLGAAEVARTIEALFGERAGSDLSQTA